MPPKKSLSESDRAVINEWIATGAAWGRDLTAPADDMAQNQPASDWWSLQPLRRPEVPSQAGSPWPRNPIDHFVLAKLAEKGLRPSPEADRRTLVRRLYFDLIGLPPSPAEVRAFLDDREPQAYERLVDRLLASPHYGERWARHWLDVVHYGETHGYDKDKPRENAWPYRDYVIRAFNADKPYGRFVQEQIAGDVLFSGTRDGIEALGFIAAGPWDFIGHAELPETKIDGKIARHLDRDDMVANTTGTFISLTVQCAQCHDHKFDPITQEDYYSLQAVFAALDRADKSYTIESSPVGENARPATTGIVYAGTVHHGSGSFAGTGASGGRPREIRVLLRGDVTQPGEVVAPGAVAAVPGLVGRFELPREATEGDARAALARWLTAAENPLTWRSIVNRLWLYHFGRGLVDTPNDFGRMGQLPSHPELLDWLAVEFRDGGQSIKSLHRLIVTSATYRQSSSPPDGPEKAAGEAIDAGNAYYWRMNRRKLEAEAVRDSILAVSGKLDGTMYGPSFKDFVIEKPEHSPHYRYDLHDPEDKASHRRAVYRFLVRSQQQPFMAALDCADPSMAVEKRNQSVTPLEALALLNNKLAVAMARHFAARLAASAENLENQINLAFQLALAREPSPSELRTLSSYAKAHGMPNTCRLIFNLNEFVFVD
jgi:hypothetical protein